MREETEINEKAVLAGIVPPSSVHEFTFVVEYEYVTLMYEKKWSKNKRKEGVSILAQTRQDAIKKARSQVYNTLKSSLNNPFKITEFKIL